MPNPNFKALGKTMLTTAKGEAIIARNAIHSFGMRFPITLALIALAIGNVAGVILHI